jgi:hypothetical protein
MKPGRGPDETVGRIPVVDCRSRPGQTFERVGKAADFRKDQGVLVFTHRFPPEYCSRKS